MRTSASHVSRTAVLLLGCCCCAGMWVWGQVRVDTRAPAHVTTQVNTQLYGGGGGGSVRYARGQSSVPMASEFRHAYWKSGALPSDVRMGYAALGPMNPAGRMAYIPPKPSYLQKPASAPPPPARPPITPTGSVRYATPHRPTGAAGAGASVVSTAAKSPRVSSSLVSRGPINSSPVNAGPIRYTR